jgi:hypothetical protein
MTLPANYSSVVDAASIEILFETVLLLNESLLEKGLPVAHLAAFLSELAQAGDRLSCRHSNGAQKRPTPRLINDPLS